MKIMIVDDDATNRKVLSIILDSFNVETLYAKNGKQAVQTFEEMQPDIVLMDILMPEMDGYEACRRIKAMCGDKFVPVIFITGITDTEAVVKAVEAGGDDFVTKPYNTVAIKAKIDAMERIRLVHEKMCKQQQELEKFHNQQQHELKLAKHVFSSIVDKNANEIPGLRAWLEPASLFNGDILLYAVTPAGGLHVMLGDFTGHGLSAALGAMPVSDIFYGMTKKGFSIGDIVEELNKKLYASFPPDMFCAACLLEIDSQYTSISAWNGAMPDICIVDTSGSITSRIGSSCPALGVLPRDQFQRSVEIIQVQEGDRVYMYSDGLIRANNEHGNKFGKQKIIDLLANPYEIDRFQSVLRTVEAHTEGAKQCDDISFVEMIISPNLKWEADEGKQALKTQQSTAWQIQTILDINTIKDVNPVPLLLNMVMQVQQTSGHRERMFTILSELVSNAIDHGILNLDSKMKRAPDGFLQYYQARTERLASRTGWIKIDIEHSPKEQGGVLTIRVEDSGKGFAFAECKQELSDCSGYSGRGIPLLKKLCDEIYYSGTGNTVTAVYSWE
jgi:CheY-like chemotaxis protein/anti-sigma regulatory factor (Ser/Thr protein kinase)